MELVDEKMVDVCSYFFVDKRRIVVPDYFSQQIVGIGKQEGSVFALIFLYVIYDVVDDTQCVKVFFCVACRQILFVGCAV